MKKLVLLFVAFYLVFNVSCQEKGVAVRVNDENVRIRERPGVDGKIVKTLNNGTLGEYLEKTAINTQFSYRIFNWIKISVDTATGWVYGEYVDFIDPSMQIKKNRVYNSNEIKLKWMGKVLYLGMGREDLLKKLGKPLDIVVDESRKLEDFRYPDGFTIEVDQITKCVTYFRITDPMIELLSGVRVGMDFDAVLSASKETEFDGGEGYIYSPTYNTGLYPVYVIFEIDSARRIEAINIGCLSY